MAKPVKELIQELTGQSAPFNREIEQQAIDLLDGEGIGYSQMNEILLTLGLDRMSKSLFQYLVNGTPNYVSGAAIRTVEGLSSGVERFRKSAAIRYGNIKYAFKYWAALEEEYFAREVRLLDPVDESEYSRRHEPLMPINEISGAEAYYLGYMIQRELERRLAENPQDSDACAEQQRRNEIISKGEQNQIAYLASDHMDVYVATSMRERHEYMMVNEFVRHVFEDERLIRLKLRWFDPTQAFCRDRIDKGLAEALMLKRATCTLYLAQENDTLGKDSELASTLAQGKPVIAYIPEITDTASYVDNLLAMVGGPVATCIQILTQLRVFAPEMAWKDAEVMGWVNDPQSMDQDRAKRRLGEVIRQHYDKRACTLRDTHPLGVQVNLWTGVANGVLVARSADQCAELIWRVMTNRLEFDLEEKHIGGDKYLLLVEKTTRSVYRVVSGNTFLTNAFWNFYLIQGALTMT
jgi:hypothetical protein